MDGHEGYNNRLIKQRSGIWRSLRDGDFDEEEIWDVLKDKKASTSNAIKTNYMGSTIHVQRSVLTTAKMIPKPNATSSSTEVGKVMQHQSSAPVNIPDWSKFNRKKSKKNSTSLWLDRNDDDDDGVDRANEGYSDDDEEEEEEDEHDDKYRLPPHEIIARRLARTQISSFSVFEGVGRTLKGRDLSKVRNAVLTKTGFLESL